MSQKKSTWTPEITYEDTDEGQLGNLPLIHVPQDEEMPRFLMMWEARETGEIEPGPTGEDVPVVEWELRQYARMDALQGKLSAEDYDKVRAALGLKPMKEAVPLGRQITQSVREAVQKKEFLSTGKKF